MLGLLMKKISKVRLAKCRENIISLKVRGKHKKECLLDFLEKTYDHKKEDWIVQRNNIIKLKIKTCRFIACLKSSLKIMVKNLKNHSKESALLMIKWSIKRFIFAELFRKHDSRVKHKIW